MVSITLFTSNQPRHMAFARQLSEVCDKLHIVSETTTLFPGEVNDFYRSSETMSRYFKNVIAAEKKLFGGVGWPPEGAAVLPISLGDLNRLPRETLKPALQADIYIVFGASYIKGWLIDFLVQHRAINIHAGISPYYRGASCNFWAVYDGLPNFVGSTIHMLSTGLDSGPMLYHALPSFNGENPFEFTMKSIPAAFDSICARIANREIFEFDPVSQDKSVELRYTRNSAFDDNAAQEFLDRELTAGDIERMLATTKKPTLLRPYFQK